MDADLLATGTCLSFSKRKLTAICTFPPQCASAACAFETGKPMFTSSSTESELLLLLLVLLFVVSASATKVGFFSGVGGALLPRTLLRSEEERLEGTSLSWISVVLRK